MKYICPTCGGGIEGKSSVSPDYELLECFGFKKVKVGRNKWKEVKCGYREFIKIIVDK